MEEVRRQKEQLLQKIAQQVMTRVTVLSFKGPCALLVTDTCVTVLWQERARGEHVAQQEGVKASLETMERRLSHLQR